MVHKVSHYRAQPANDNHNYDYFYIADKNSDHISLYFFTNPDKGIIFSALSLNIKSTALEQGQATSHSNTYGSKQLKSLSIFQHYMNNGAACHDFQTKATGASRPLYGTLICPGNLPDTRFKLIPYIVYP